MWVLWRPGGLVLLPPSIPLPGLGFGVVAPLWVIGFVTHPPPLCASGVSALVHLGAGSATYLSGCGGLPPGVLHPLTVGILDDA